MNDRDIKEQLEGLFSTTPHSKTEPDTEIEMTLEKPKQEEPKATGTVPVRQPPPSTAGPPSEPSAPSLPILGSLSGRLSLILVLITLIPLMIVGIISYQRSRQAIESIAKTEVRNTTQAAVRNTENFLEQYRDDTLTLGEAPPLQGIIRAKSNDGIDPQSSLTMAEWKEHLSELFTALAENTKLYQQIRYIDETGMEIVRVDYAGQEALPIPEDTLQDKSDRDYFQATMNLRPGEIYVSALNLNQEQGQVQIPYTPVLRFATPIFDTEGNRRGIVILNVYADIFLSRLFPHHDTDTGTSTFIQDFLINQDGYYLHHDSDPSQEFAFDLEMDHNANTDYAWEMSQIEGQDAFVGTDPSGEFVISMQKVQFDPRRPERYWVLMERLPRDLVLGEVNTLGAIVGGATGGVMILAIIIAVWLARTITRPIRTLADASQRVAQGDFDVPLPQAGSDEIGVLSRNFDAMVHRLKTLVGSLQQQSQELEERATQLEANQRAIRVTFAASETTNPDELLGLVVNLIRDQFNLYHVQVYMIDEGEGAAILRESTGYAGRQLLQKKHRIPLDQPALVTKAIQEGTPVLVKDVRQDESFLPNPLLPDTQSELVVPLKTGERVIGALDAQSRVIGLFDDDMVGLFETMAEQVALLFQNVELLVRTTEQTQELTQFTTQLRTAADMSERLSGILDPSQLLNEVVELMRSRFGFYHVHIYTLNEAMGDLVVAAGSGEVGRVLRERGHKIPLDRPHSLVARAARNRELVVVNDTSLESDFLPNPLLPQTRSEVAVPLVAGGQVLGVLDVQDDQADRFSPTDTATFNTLAGQIATALDNARLFEEQRRAEQAIRDLQRQNEQILNSAGEGIYGVDQNGITTFINPAAEQMLDWPAQDLIGKSHHDLIHHTKPDGEPYPQEECPIYAAYRDGTTHQGDDEIYWRKDGTSFPVSYTSMPIRDEDGELVGAVVTFRDITERLQAEERVREVNERLTLAQKSITLGVWDWDVRENILVWDDAMYELYGVKPEDFGGAYEAWRSGLHPDDVEQGDAEIQAALAGEKEFDTEFRVVHPDGSIHYIKANATVIRDDDGTPIRMVGLNYNITERKQAEEEVQKRAAELETVSEISTITSTILEPQELLQTVVDLTKDNFDLYHAHIYLMDKAEENLVLAAGAGEPGRQMVTEGWQIPADREDSLVAQAFRGAEGVIVNDVRENPNFLPNPLLPDTRAEMAVPMIVGDRVLGVLDVQSARIGRFTQEDVNIKTTLARQVATALDNARLFEEQTQAEEEVQKRAAELETVSEISTITSTILEPQELLQTVVDLTKDNFDLYHAHIYLMDKAEENLVLAAGAGEPGRQMVTEGWQIPADREDSLVAQAFRGAEGVIVNDVRENPNFLPNPLLPDTRAEMAVPMIVGDRVLGVLDVQSARIGRFTQEDVNIKTTLARQIATALDNARLFEEQTQAEEKLLQQAHILNERIKELNTLYSVSNLVEQTDLSLDELAQEVANLLPSGWQYTESTGARVVLEGKSFATENFQETVWTQESDIVIQGETIGSVQVCYLEEKPESDDGPFMKEEIELLDVIAKQLGEAIETRRAEEAQARLTAILEATNDFVGIAAPDGQAVYVNRAGRRMVGFGEDEDVTAYSIADMQPPSAIELLDSIGIPTAIQEGIWSGETFFVNRDGREIPVLQVIMSHKSADGTVQYLSTIARDITEQKEAERERERLIAILTNSRDMIALTNMEGEITYINPAGARLAGYETPEQAHGKVIADFHTPEDLKLVEEQGLPTAFQEGAWRGENRLRRLDGTIIPVDQTIFIIQDDEGKPQSLATIISDITERKLAERALRESEQYNRSLFEESPIGLALARMDGTLMDINPAYAQIIGRTVEETLTLSYWDITPEKYAEQEEEQIEKLQETGRYGPYEKEYIHKDGHLVPVQLSGLIIERGGETYIWSSVEDITERKQAEAEIKKRAAELQTVAEVSTAASTILETDELLQTVVDYTKNNFDLYHAHIYLIDEAEENLVLAAGAGEPGRQMVAEGWQIPANREDSLVAQAFRSAEGVIVNDVRENPNFLPNPLLPDTRAEMAVPMIVGDRVLGVLDVQSNRVGRFTEEDVSIKTTLARQVATALENARLFEEIQRTADRLREVDQLKSEFLANMSHELRTPLNSIIGYTEIMLMGIEGELDPEMQEDVEAIYENGQHLLRLINDILDLAKIEAGHMALSMEQVDIEPLLDDVRTNNAGLVLNKPVEILIEADQDLPPVEGDRVRLSQVLNNLVSNAVKFTDEGTVTMRAFSDDGWAYIQVEDTGIGMSEHDLDIIFERFRQVDGSSTRKAEGTGLGLSITRHLIEMHGGDIEVHSQLGEGSTFTVRLPFEQFEQTDEQADLVEGEIGVNGEM